MTQHLPFIKKFEDEGFFYVYDVNTNQVVEVEKPVYDLIDKDTGDLPQLEKTFDGTYSPAQIQETIAEIESAKSEHGLFSASRPKAVTLGCRTADGIKKLHEAGLQQLILEVTKSCNFKCGYCHAAGKYFDPPGKTMEMSGQTCREAVDFFCARANKPDAFITFYGGEPLLRFDLIRDTVEYAEKTYPALSFTFNLTTNGSLLNREILDFFIEHDFIMMVSLDGPQTVNDRYRKFRNGKGTFGRVMDKLEWIRKTAPDYFKQKVSISSVLAPPFHDIRDTLDFFSTHPLFEPIRGSIRSGLVEARETPFFEDFLLEGSGKEYQEVVELFGKRLKDALINEKLDSATIEKNKLHDTLYNLARRPIKQVGPYVHPLGACHIGLRRVFVETGGEFFACERAPDTYRAGNLQNGFDYERIAGFYRSFEEKLEDCRDCWIVSHCERCWAAVGKLDEFTGDEKKKFCSMSKQVTEQAFTLYTQLLRENPGCLAQLTK